METYKAGVLIIGSLLWDNTHGRKAWREHYFGEDFTSNIIDVKVPIRYGRYSKGRKCPTMVFSHDFFKNERFGTAKILPFKNQEMRLDELICAARDLSSAEDSTSREFIKGGNTKWCILICWLNSKMKEEKKNSFIGRWSEKYGQKLTNEFLDNFKMESENESLINENGCLKIEWPESLSTYDLVLATQTKPRCVEDDSSDFLNTGALASQIFKRPEYFIKNKLNGITTAEDDAIIRILKKKDLSEFKENALKNGCSKQERDSFIQVFLK